MTGGRPPDPATDHTLLMRAPIVQVRRLSQQDHRRSQAEFPLAEDGTGGSRNDQRRSHTPDQLSGLPRRQKERWVHVSQPVLAAGVLLWIGLPDNRLNDSRDQVPVVAELDRNHGLNVQHILRAVVRPVGEVRVVLQRHADQAGHRILHCFLQLLCADSSEGAAPDFAGAAFCAEPIIGSVRNTSSNRSDD